MSDDNKKLFPINISQNPYPVLEDGQQFNSAVQAQIENIMAEFEEIVPSNYVSEVPGPFYNQQFQTAAEQLAKFQLVAQEVFGDADYDFTRSEFLWETVISLVFPQGNLLGIPKIEGDTNYRTFIKAMILLLLRGSKPDVVKEGVELLTDAEVSIIEKVLTAGEEGSAWDLDDQFGFELFISNNEGTDFPENPFILKENVRLVIQALKPAHTLYDYAHLFRETFENLIQDYYEIALDTYYYEDFRQYCNGLKSLTGTQGKTLSNQFLFCDVSRDFSQVTPGKKLTITSGSNAGDYLIESVLSLPVPGQNLSPVPYVTFPTGLTGELIILNDDDFYDDSQDWSLAVEGEVLTIQSGSNAGEYRLKTLLGNNGGPLGQATGPATGVRPAKSILKLKSRVFTADTGMSYYIELDRLGVKRPLAVVGEDVSSFFSI